MVSNFKCDWCVSIRLLSNGSFIVGQIASLSGHSIESVYTSFVRCR